MKRAALLWLVLVLAASAYLLTRLLGGVQFQTDFTALLPQEERDPGVQQAKDRVAQILNRRIVVLIGDRERATARAAGAALAEELRHSGLTASVTYTTSGDGLRKLGESFFRYRFGLLTAGDRALLQQGRGEEIVARALASVYGPIGIADANLLRHDPFLLLPTYLADLPRPLPRLAPDDGVLSTQDGHEHYVLITAELAGDPFALAFADRFVARFDQAEQRLRAATPELRVLRLGTIFYAEAGAAAATRETSAISIVSLLGTVLLVLAVFRALRPLGLTLLAIGTGVICAFAVSLWLFGTLHVAALLFGVSLIGIALDYCLQYLTARFNPEDGTPAQRLRRVLPGIVLGITTTLIGYLTLLLAPFPGLRQVAVFSAVGLVASFATVLLWLPALDQAAPLAHGEGLLRAAGWLWEFWEEPRRRYRWPRQVLCAALAVAALLGAWRLRAEDDIRRYEALSPPLKQQEAELRRLTGINGGTELLLVRAADEESALETEESLLDRLQQGKAEGVLSGFQAIAQVIPSAARQRDNRTLVRDRLMAPFLASYDKRLGLPAGAAHDVGDPGPLTLAAIPAGSPLALLHDLDLGAGTGGAMHVVLLYGVARLGALRQIAEAVPGVRLIDPVGDLTRLLGQYRRRAVLVLALSALLMLPVVYWRYGLRGGMRVALPPAIAVLATPPLVALAGVPFTFFNAMALVLVLSVGFDYAVFCRETDAAHRPATMLGVWLAMATTLLSFGLLGASRVFAVHAFGITLLVGTLLAFFAAPVAGTSTTNRSRLSQGGQ